MIYTNNIYVYISLVLQWMQNLKHIFHTSRKICQKKTQPKSIDQPYLQSLNDGRFFSVLPTEILGMWGRVIYCRNGLGNSIPTIYYTLPNS